MAVKTSFRTWLETPEQTGAWWALKRPTDGPYNFAEVGRFAEAMADPWLNEQTVALALYGRPVPSQLRYHAPIADNLLTLNSPLLQDAYGVVAHPIEPAAAFDSEGDRAGAMFVQHPPVLYTERTIKSVQGVVIHELRHAADWITPRYRKKPASSVFLFDLAKYAKHVSEARAYADQVAYLMAEVKDKAEVESILQTGPFGMDRYVFMAAKAFLSTLKPQNEAWAAKLAAPLMMGLAAGQPAVPAVKPVTAAVKTQDAAKRAANALATCFNLMVAENFMRFSV